MYNIFKILLTALILTTISCAGTCDSTIKELEQLKAEKYGQSKDLKVASKQLEDYLSVWVKHTAKEIASQNGQKTTIHIDEYTFLDNFNVAMVKFLIEDSKGVLTAYSVFFRIDSVWLLQDVSFGEFVPRSDDEEL